MKLAILSDCRMPTLPHGSHGLGRMAWDIAAGLVKRGHEVALHAGPDSAWGGDVGFPTLITTQGETVRAAHIRDDNIDAWLDLSHQHDLSRLRPELPVVNWLADTECDWQPPRAVVGNAWQQRGFPKARIVPLGVDVERIPLMTMKVKPHYLAYCAKIHPAKGFDIALQVGTQSGLPVRFAGEKFVDAALPNYRGVIDSDGELHAFIGSARGLLSPSRLDAGGRVNLEAAACGTPVLCLDGTGTMCHVEHGLSGFICRDADEMADAVLDLGLLDPQKMRQWVKEAHDLSVMIDGIETLLKAAADGEAW